MGKPHDFFKIVLTHKDYEDMDFNDYEFNYLESDGFDKDEDITTIIYERYKPHATPGAIDYFRESTPLNMKIKKPLKVTPFFCSYSYSPMMRRKHPEDDTPEKYVLTYEIIKEAKKKHINKFNLWDDIKLYLYTIHGICEI